MNHRRRQDQQDPKQQRPQSSSSSWSGRHVPRHERCSTLYTDRRQPPKETETVVPVVDSRGQAALVPPIPYLHHFLHCLAVRLVGWLVGWKRNKHFATGRNFIVSFLFLLLFFFFFLETTAAAVVFSCVRVCLVGWLDVLYGCHMYADHSSTQPEWLFHTTKHNGIKYRIPLSFRPSHHPTMTTTTTLTTSTTSMLLLL